MREVPDPIAELASRIPPKPVPWHFHKWTKFSDVGDGEYGKPYQDRSCVVCNKMERHYLYDGSRTL